MSKKPIHSDLKRIDAMSDQDIDYSDIPEFDDAFLESVDMKFSPGKKANSLARRHRRSGVDEIARQRLSKPDECNP